MGIVISIVISIEVDSAAEDMVTVVEEEGISKVVSEEGPEVVVEGTSGMTEGTIEMQGIAITVKVLGITAFINALHVNRWVIFLGFVTKRQVMNQVTPMLNNNKIIVTTKPRREAQLHAGPAKV